MNRTLLLLPALALAVVGCKSYSERAEDRTYEPHYYSQSMPQGRMVVGHMPGHYETTSSQWSSEATVLTAPGQYRMYNYTNLRDSWGNPVLTKSGEPVGAVGDEYIVTTGSEINFPPQPKYYDYPLPPPPPPVQPPPVEIQDLDPEKPPN